MFTDPTFGQLIEGIYDGMAGLDKNLVILMGGRPEEDRRIAQYVQSGHVDGLIHLNQLWDDSTLRALSNTTLPMVLTGPPPPVELPKNHAVVTIDDIAATEQALDYLLETGSDRIAMITGDMRATGARLRVKAYQETMGEALDPALIVEGDYSFESGYKGMHTLIFSGQKFDAVFCSSDRMAAGAIAAANEQGIDIPGDVRIVGFDDHHLAARLDPPLTTVRQPIREIGAAAVAVLNQAIQGGSISDKVFPTELIIRRST